MPKWYDVPDMSETNPPSLHSLLFPVFLWFLINEYTPYINRIAFLQPVTAWLYPLLRIGLVLLVTWLYIRLAEGKTFAGGFHLRFQRIPDQLYRALLYGAAGVVIIAVFRRLLLNPVLYGRSAAPALAAGLPFISRQGEAGYLLLRGAVQALVLAGFLVDRLRRSHGPGFALIFANLLFALWHYPYLKLGIKGGILMMTLALLTGFVISLNYLKTQNTLSSVVCYWIIDLPVMVGVLFAW